MSNFFKQFGGKATKEKLQKYETSPNWKDGKFQNLEETSMDISVRSLPSLLYKQIFKTEGRRPEQDIEIKPFKEEEFLLPSDSAEMIWYGHAVLLMRIQNKTVLIDPMLGPNASPIAPFPTKRFSKNSLDIIDQLPEIDLLIMTHDHYDHLDLASMTKLQPKVKQYYVALGVGRHLEKWGVAPNLITEFDWWDSNSIGKIDVTFTPSRHFSGRGATDRAKSLWGGWVFHTPFEKIYFSGDGGYGEHFKEIGNRLGPFDFGIMECGQYNEQWHQIHMYPEESVQAAVDAGVQKAMAVHWAGFALAQHHWKDPIERFTKAAEKQDLPILTPPIGQIFSRLYIDSQPWWEETQ